MAVVPQPTVINELNTKPTRTNISVVFQACLLSPKQENRVKKKRAKDAQGCKRDDDNALASQQRTTHGGAAVHAYTSTVMLPIMARWCPSSVSMAIRMISLSCLPINC